MIKPSGIFLEGFLLLLDISCSSDYIPLMDVLTMDSSYYQPMVVPMGIQSLADNDLYKFTMQQAVLKHYPKAIVEYRFKNRGNQKFDDRFKALFEQELEKMQYLQFSSSELEFLNNMKFVQHWYTEFLRGYRFNPNEVSFTIENGELDLRINGPWYRTILWEVPLMALISEIYFYLEKQDGLWNMEGQERKLEIKTNILMTAHCRYADFGTRRRRCFEVQDMVVKRMYKHHWFVGTSNVHLACKYGVKAIGTMAHEWVQGISALESMNHPNRFMLQKWIDVYESNLGIALTDTYGTDSFFKDFNRTLASIYDGVRHDSGDPFEFADKVVSHYKSLDVDHTSKTIVFSDGLKAETAALIQAHCDRLGINCSFGIGTSFTNDFDTPALNMVIKLWMVNGFHVVKLSDISGKENGEETYVNIMKRIHTPDRLKEAA